MNDRVRITMRVEVVQALAFSVFTEQLDGWWRRGKRYRLSDDSVMTLSPGVGGKLTESFVHRGKARVFEIGVVRVWDPPRQLLIEWRPVNFKERDPSTEVEVSFERAIGHSGEHTLVTLEHRGWSRIRTDHPVRHGQSDSEFLASLGRWWGDLAATLRNRAEPRVPNSE
ncbi:MAG TPA: hypothetical protein VHM70_32755 [Polyangiaceae bacterium]|jgi:hypothetical protein|nr:hypothetical protein [Polyangiaceae bacterium]